MRWDSVLKFVRLICPPASTAWIISNRGELPYISHIGMCRPKGKNFSLFWSENGYRLESGIVFEGATGCMCILVDWFQMNKKYTHKVRIQK